MKQERHEREARTGPRWRLSFPNPPQSDFDRSVCVCMCVCVCVCARERVCVWSTCSIHVARWRTRSSSFFSTLVTGPRRSLSLKLSDTRVYARHIRARLGTTAHFGWAHLLHPRGTLAHALGGRVVLGRVLEALVLHQRRLVQLSIKNNHLTEMCSGFEAGSYLRLIDFCITRLYAWEQ